MSGIPKLADIDMPQLEPMNIDVRFVGPFSDYMYIHFNLSTGEIVPGSGKYGKIIKYDDHKITSSKTSADAFIDSVDRLPEQYRPRSDNTGMVNIYYDDNCFLGHLNVKTDGSVFFSDKNKKQFSANDKEIILYQSELRFL